MAAHPEPHGALSNPDTSHEHSDVDVRAVIWSAVVLASVCLAIQVAMWGMFRVLDKYEVKNEPAVTPMALPAGEAPPGPRLQTTPWTDLKNFTADQKAYATSYGWIDEKSGIARVPIAKAKEMLLQRGIPVRPELADAAEGTHVAATGESNGGRSLPAGGADKSSPVAPVSGAPASPSVAPAKPGGGGL
jgi:hypothetical protein